MRSSQVFGKTWGRFHFSNAVRINSGKGETDSVCRVTVFKTVDELLADPLVPEYLRTSDSFKKRVTASKSYWAFDQEKKVDQLLTFEKELSEEKQVAELSSRIIGALHAANVSSVGIRIADAELEGPAQRLLARYLPLHNYSWSMKTKKEEEEYLNVDEITLLLSSNSSELEETIELESRISHFRNIARGYVNTRADVATPDFFASEAQRFVESSPSKRSSHWKSLEEKSSRKKA